MRHMFTLRRRQEAKRLARMDTDCLIQTLGSSAYEEARRRAGQDAPQVVVYLSRNKAHWVRVRPDRTKDQPSQRGYRDPISDGRSVTTIQSQLVQAVPGSAAGCEPRPCDCHAAFEAIWVLLVSDRSPETSSIQLKDLLQ